MSTINIKECKKILELLDNHFGIIILSPKWTFAATDYSRGYPIFWKKEKKILKLSVQANLIKNKDKDIDLDQIVAFRMSGYTIDNGTLWKNIKALNAGSFLFTNYNNNFLVKKYFQYIPYQNNNLSYSDYRKKLKYQIDSLIKKIILKAKGNTIIVPLSAGLDSRLIASGLRQFKYDNVKCFSYGIKNNYEAVASEKISKKLGYKWIFVNITHTKAKKFYKSDNYKNYLKRTADGSAASTIQGLFAIDYLITKGFVKKGDIIINGNSGDFISGGHINKKVKDHNILVRDINKKIDKVLYYHFDKHYSLWDKLITNENKTLIRNKLLDQIKHNIEEKEVALYALEYLEFENRQTKYVLMTKNI